ncbi:P-loop NTPase family protein [Oecophyllibacter saccharovorans]|uniref:DnaA ATPase domain-containing protein n=1 Tax=Oecophyllibacter saccharovorans TaxID=2558360 RepID=UPI001E3BC460|nr:DnaA/Hda family protein [Oecophyllibacter saccharovorans]
MAETRTHGRKGPSQAGQKQPEKSGAQMALALAAERGTRERPFIAAQANAQARSWLARPRWPAERLWLWGNAGVGKTHLMHAWAREQETRGRKVQWLQAGGLTLDSLGQICVAGVPWEGEHAPLMAPGLDIVIDNIETLADEAALLHLLNHVQHLNAGLAPPGHHLLLAARLPPARQVFTLADLASRLRAIPAVEVQEPDDRLRSSLLLSLLAARQLVVAPTVIEWLERHLPRTAQALITSVDRLDALALARGAPVTRALAAEGLADLLTAVEEPAVADEEGKTT